MGNNNENNSNTSKKEMWGCIGTIIAALITGVIALIIAGKIPFPPSTPTAIPLQNKIDAISGTWVGTAKSGDFEFGVTFVVGENCSVGVACGTFNFPEISCSGTLAITKIDGNLFEFQANDRTSGCNVSPDIRDSLQLLPDGTLLYTSKGSGYGETRGILKKEK